MHRPVIKDELDLDILASPAASEAIHDAMRLAASTSQELLEAGRVDPTTLREPMTAGDCGIGKSGSQTEE